MSRLNLLSVFLLKSIYIALTNSVDTDEKLQKKTYNRVPHRLLLDEVYSLME